MQRRRSILAELIRRVLEAMFGLEVRCRAQSAGSSGAAEVTAAVYFAGQWHGALVLDCTMAHARAWTARLLGRPVCSSHDEAARDGLVEIANLLAGKLKPLLPPGSVVPIPVPGSGHGASVCGLTCAEHLSFADPYGAFRVTLVQVAENA
jgi:CheY-specific phosphatase CheX